MIAFGTLSTNTGFIFHRGTTGFLTQIKTIKFINYSANDVLVTIQFTNGINTLIYDRYLLLSGDSLEVSPSYPIDYEKERKKAVDNLKKSLEEWAKSQKGEGNQAPVYAQVQTTVRELTEDIDKLS